ncbi:hypothetical protein, variant [Cladophialophora immunda]|nr:hypothetical protein, variant [Cladophialophora immunda]KIW30191.1 hypothetical protein, variant [Cladophialophora immunda]
MTCQGIPGIGCLCDLCGLVVLFDDISAYPPLIDLTTTPSSMMSHRESRETSVSNLHVQQPNVVERDPQILSIPRIGSAELMENSSFNLSLHEPGGVEGNPQSLTPASLTMPSVLRCPHCKQCYGSGPLQAQRFR